MLMNELQAINPDLLIRSIQDDSFVRFGRVLRQINVTEIVQILNEQTPLPETGNIYVASFHPMEDTAAAEAIKTRVYGGMSIQVGYCNGMGTKMNALEYHKCPEVLIAGTDLVLMLGKVEEVKDLQFSSSKLELFYVQAGDAIELYSDTLHFAPCRVNNQAFRAGIILTRGTNSPLIGKPAAMTEEDQLLFMQNKWLIAHPDSPSAKEKQAFAGIEGDNLSINPLKK